MICIWWPMYNIQIENWDVTLDVCGKYMSCTLYLIYSRLCWCLMLILILVFSSALAWLTHIILVEPISKLPLLYVAQLFVFGSARLCFLHAHLHLLWVSIDFGGVMILFCAPCIHIQKKSYLCTNHGELL